MKGVVESESVSGTTLFLWSTGAFSVARTEHVGATAIEYSHSDALPIGPAFVIDCDLVSSTAACPELMSFTGQSGTRATSSVTPFETFGVSVSATAARTSSSKNTAGPLKPFGSLAGACVVVVFLIVAVVPA
ncbi:hypothetical protein DFJ43DRAFT_1153822 [Lentinula guzmanii]|uniref:Uncharacterized protein n=1 Tax=Lentinula guzmanii TaxID=2804957 RepID=A0AA38JHB6_9AGAR|nr:hypothetical protein DFJ43DRAFT_1153822 [Lentinula guzmanii]